jgi:CRISPR system Cascade subunit CasE
MYLSRLILNLRQRKVREHLADRFELHRTIMSGFPTTLAEGERVLFRVETAEREIETKVLVQSQLAPDWGQSVVLNSTGYLMQTPLVRPVVAQAVVGQRVPFRLQANPTFKHKGKRQAHYTEVQALDWLLRKGEQHGFALQPLDVRVNMMGKVFGKKRQQTWFIAQFDGVLTITDARFEQALVEGIGSAKAFGFGLLSIPYAPA